MLIPSSAGQPPSSSTHMLHTSVAAPEGAVRQPRASCIILSRRPPCWAFSHLQPPRPHPHPHSSTLPRRCNDYTCSSDYCTGCDGNNGNPDYCGYLSGTGSRCLSWCNTYTCTSSPVDCGGCTSSPNCADTSTFCEGWCNQVRPAPPRTAPHLLPVLPPRPSGCLLYTSRPRNQWTTDSEFCVGCD